MKTTKFFLALIVVAIFSVAAMPASHFTLAVKESQSKANGFDFIRTHRQGDGAAITWAYTNGNAVSFKVERTYEDPSDPYAVWETLCDVPCNAARSYKHHDVSVFPGMINYRVKALLNDGTVETSDVSTVHIMKKK